MPTAFPAVTGLSDRGLRLNSRAGSPRAANDWVNRTVRRV